MKRMKHLGAIVALGALTVAGLMISPASASTGSTATIFNSIPGTLPGNVPSLAFDSTLTSEFGDYARFAATKRSLQKVTVVMSSWGCESGTYDARVGESAPGAGDGVPCQTTPGATFPTEITLKLYGNPGGGVVGGELATSRQTFNIPYRPSADPTCAVATKWKATNGTCYNGLATRITFTFTGVTLPASVIYGIAYNTTSYGYHPIGVTACNTEVLGCGYDVLNVASASTRPQKGVDDDVNGVFLYSSWTGAYCPDPNAQTNTFRLDSPCWTGGNPMVKFVAR